MLMKREAKYVVYKNGEYHIDVSFVYEGQEQFFKKQARVMEDYPEEKGYSVKLVSDKKYETRDDIVNRMKSIWSR